MSQRTSLSCLSTERDGKRCIHYEQPRHRPSAPMGTITTQEMNQHSCFAVTRRDFLICTTALTLNAALSGAALAQSGPTPLSSNSTNGAKTMGTITTRD